MKAAFYKLPLPELRGRAVTPTIEYLINIVPDIYRVSGSPNTVTTFAKRNIDGLESHPFSLPPDPQVEGQGLRILLANTGFKISLINALRPGLSEGKIPQN